MDAMEVNKISGNDKERKIAIDDKSNWTKLFAASPSQSLQVFTPQEVEGKVIVAPPIEAFEEGVDLWSNAVVAQFIRKMPNFSLFQRLVNVLWGDDGHIDIRPAGVNVFIIQFPNSSMRDRVLESGPWHIQNKPIIVRKWEPGMRSLEFNMEKLPPLYMDKITANQKRLSYAKVCVEMEATKDIPRLLMSKCRMEGISQYLLKYHGCRKDVLNEGIAIVVNKDGEDALTEKVMTKDTSKKPFMENEVEHKAENTPLVKKKRESENGESSSSFSKKKEGTKARSANRFAILDEMVDEEEALLAELARKPRAASSRVVELMKTLQPKKKVDKELKNQVIMLDYAYNGPLFTWTNKQMEGFLARKLDRVLINDVWLDRFVDSTVDFLPPEVSNHSPTLI
ncbi:hypothetical protein DITRI_Ditri20bG0143500 [Diplodiscus trichospermus]